MSAGHDGAVLLRVSDELIASGADGLIVAGPDGLFAQNLGQLAKSPAAEGWHQIIDPVGATHAFTG